MFSGHDKQESRPQEKQGEQGKEDHKPKQDSLCWRWLMLSGAPSRGSRFLRTRAQGSTATKCYVLYFVSALYFELLTSKKSRSHKVIKGLPISPTQEH